MIASWFFLTEKGQTEKKKKKIKKKVRDKLKWRITTQILTNLKEIRMDGRSQFRCSASNIHVVM